MKFSHILMPALPLALAALLTSCFKSEPLNAECDIEQAYVSVAHPDDFFFNPSDTLVNVASDRNAITFDVRMSANLQSMSPHFVLTPGATIVPANGSAHDFSDGRRVEYMVTSQDGQWHRTYSVGFKPMYRYSSDEVDYTFDHCALNSTDKYYVWTHYNAEGEAAFEWATANPAFLLARSTAKPDEYPTVPTEGIYGGRAVMMVTRSTGAFGQMVKRPLAAGSIYIGEFDISMALTETLKATRFGMPFAMKPLKMTGYYKFVPGDVYTDSDGKVVEGVQDESTIYSVIFRNHDNAGNPIVLYGDDVQSSPYLAGMARINIRKRADEWQRFELTYDYYEDLDYELLDNNGYSMTVVACSSINGDQYRGAVGSTLCVDNLQIICEKIED